MARSRLCITTTLKYPDQTFEAWLAYHLDLGFERIFIFFDDPKDPAIERASAFRQVQAIPCDAAFIEDQARKSSYPRLLPRRATNFVARQILNVEYAVRLATELGFDWIFHIDCDEMIHLEGGLQDHVSSLPESVRSLLMLNHEALPTGLDVENAFLDVTTFKTNQYRLYMEANQSSQPLTLADILTHRGRNFVSPRVDGAELPCLSFHSFRQGKSGSRLSYGPRPGVHATKRWSSDADKNGVDVISDKVSLYHYAGAGLVNCLLRYRSWGREIHDSEKRQDLSDLAPEKISIATHDLFEVMRRDYLKSDWASFARLYKDHIQCRDALALARDPSFPFVHENTGIADAVRRLLKKTRAKAA